mmetsp:Transcript_12449/g.20918  ORF Transcript_12449/g.20918 Transcript_12449/m.20918 type:complete len:524 (+) Transcript_12449:435-2006(+)
MHGLKAELVLGAAAGDEYFVVGDEVAEVGLALEHVLDTVGLVELHRLLGVLGVCEVVVLLEGLRLGLVEVDLRLELGLEQVDKLGVLVLAATTQHKDLAVGRHRRHRLTHEQVAPPPVHRRPLELQGQEADHVPSQPLRVFCETLWLALLFRREPLASLALELEHVLEVNEEEGVGLGDGLGEERAVGGEEVGAARDELGDAVLQLADLDSDLAGVALGAQPAHLKRALLDVGGQLLLLFVGVVEVDLELDVVDHVLLLAEQGVLASLGRLLRELQVSLVVVGVLFVRLGLAALVVDLVDDGAVVDLHDPLDEVVDVVAVVQVALEVVVLVLEDAPELDGGGPLERLPAEHALEDGLEEVGQLGDFEALLQRRLDAELLGLGDVEALVVLLGEGEELADQVEVVGLLVEGELVEEAVVEEAGHLEEGDAEREDVFQVVVDLGRVLEDTGRGVGGCHGLHVVREHRVRVQDLHVLLLGAVVPHLHARAEVRDLGLEGLVELVVAARRGGVGLDQQDVAGLDVVV